MGAWEAIGQSDEWYTPAYIFDALGVNFGMDVAAPACGPKHVPCDEWISADSLSKAWRGFVWMNPPFGGRNSLEPWLQRFVIHRNGVALVPDRTSAPWFQKYAVLADAVLFVSPKIKFERPDGTLGTQPGCGTALLGFGVLGTAAIRNANGKIGSVFIPEARK